MHRIAVIAGPDAGHALPALGLAAALRGRNHDVRFLSGPDHLLSADAMDLAADVLPLLGPTELDDDLGHRLWRRAGEMAVPLADQLRAWDPDLLVVDTLTRAGAFAAQLLDRPWVELVPHHLDDPDPDLPPIGLGRRPARTPWRRYDDRRILGLQARSLQLGVQQAGEVAAGLGLDAVGAPVLRLLATLPSFERRRRHWPPDAHVVGPLALDLGGPELEVPAGRSPLVLVTDSTATGVDTRLGEVALAGLRDVGFRLVITSDTLAPQREPGLVVGRGPHAPLLAAADLAVSPGGAGFMTKAAAAGVVQVVVPHQGDQREGAARLVDTGSGRCLPLRRLTPERLRRTVRALVDDPRAASAADALRVEAARLDPQVAVGLVEAVLAGRPPPAGSPTDHLRAL